MVTDRAKNQWVDLGIHTEVCLTQPENCGAAGGAISVWLKVIDCSQYGGIISTIKYVKYAASGGTLVYCHEENIW